MRACSPSHALFLLMCADAQRDACFCALLCVQLPAWTADPARCLREYGFAFVPGLGAAFARAFLRRMSDDLASCKKEKIAGGVDQYALPVRGAGQWCTSMRMQWHALVKMLAAHVGVDAALLEVSYHVQDEKLLIAGRRKGEQAP